MLLVQLDLDDAGILRYGLDIPSLTSNKSNAETDRLLQWGRASKSRAKGLVGRWRDRVDVAEARRAISILDRFGFDHYAADRLLPTQE